MKKILAILLIAALTFQHVKADEGMWFLAFINKNYSQMKAMGFKLSPKDIYDINHSSMKDAVVTLDGGSCTAELVSPYGLILTNHHCGYGEIQAHSSVEHDYLTDGFWAKNRSEELPNPGKTVTFLVRMEDVSERVNAELNDKMTEEERSLSIRKISEVIQKEAVGPTHYTAQVRSFFKGNNFYLFVYETFTDVRLVGAPPSSIGKYGGDTDNWMWPRHTGDFSIFRIYCGPDGKPADYSTDNVPYRPKHFFPISIKGVKENDFAMIMGYPGSTNRYLTSWGVEETIENENAIRIEVRGMKQNIIKKYMDKDPKTRIQYASKYSQSTNYYKYSIGQNKALAELKVVDDKKAIEKNFEKWIKENKAERAPKYGEALDLIKKAYKDKSEMDKVQNYWFEALYLGPEVFGSGFQLRRLQGALASGDKEAIEATAKGMEGQMDEYFKNYNVQVDKELFVSMLTLYRDKISKEYLPGFYETIDTEFGKDIQKYADKLYATSILTDQSRAKAFLANPDAATLENDLGYKAAVSCLDVYFALQEKMDAPNALLGKGMREFVAGWIQMEEEKDKNKLYYPDANSTIRLTYGTVGGYKVGDKVYDYTTDLKGLLAKEDPKNPEEFSVPDRLKELYKSKDYGPYGENGRMVVCFTSNNDITGGNSGSPVLNGTGELIGIAFDGNWEAMSGDINFDNKLQKTINVDIRYVLFIIDKYAGAKNLIDEMTIVRE
ncbi:MAG: S46 family peptidase [Bacteroidales bacterium]|nr:S46 family peptidase [Bacteroidales bacterium]